MRALIRSLSAKRAPLELRLNSVQPLFNAPKFFNAKTLGEARDGSAAPIAHACHLPRFLSGCSTIGRCAAGRAAEWSEAARAVGHQRLVRPVMERCVRGER